MKHNKASDYASLLMNAVKTIIRNAIAPQRMQNARTVLAEKFADIGEKFAEFSAVPFAEGAFSVADVADAGSPNPTGRAHNFLQKIKQGLHAQRPGMQNKTSRARGLHHTM